MIEPTTTMTTTVMRSWDSQRLLVKCGTQQRIFTVFTKQGQDSVMSVRRSEFTIPSEKFNKNTDEKVTNRDALHLDQDYVDEICIDYVQEGETDEEDYDCDDCDGIPSGVTIMICKM